MTWNRETFIATVGDAVWAPSIHNTQPWRFRRTAQSVDVLADAGRALPACDPHGRAARVSCGAAAYNLRLALAAAGEPAEYTFGRDDVLVHLTPGPPRPATPTEVRLHRQILRRHTNRFPFADRPVEPGVIAVLAAGAGEEGGWLEFMSGEQELYEVAALVRSADAQLSADPAYVAELRAWSSGADERVEGVGAAAAGPAPHPAEVLTRRDFGGPERDATRDPARTPLVAVLGAYGDGPADEVRAGMVLQRVLLAAADLGLAAGMFSQPIEVPPIRERLRRLLGRPDLPQLVLRFGYAPTTCYTNRRPVADVIEL
ncbi:Acg family FMN-binding oxidoreductase [Dactylosporangium sp. CA-139066]|uniref:Acg family FMN-binding oxidoreductase n=1 Tax=Dactylosporangium sp. CA-139066 TaxID=3239930 RepID=UPI003D8FFA1F